MNPLKFKGGKICIFTKNMTLQAILINLSITRVKFCLHLPQYSLIDPTFAQFISDDRVMYTIAEV